MAIDLFEENGCCEATPLEHSTALFAMAEGEVCFANCEIGAFDAIA